MDEYIKQIEEIATKCSCSQSDGYAQIMRICDAMKSEQPSTGSQSGMNEKEKQMLVFIIEMIRKIYNDEAFSLDEYYALSDIQDKLGGVAYADYEHINDYDHY